MAFYLGYQKIGWQKVHGPGRQSAANQWSLFLIHHPIKVWEIVRQTIITQTATKNGPILYCKPIKYNYDL